MFGYESVTTKREVEMREERETSGTKPVVDADSLEMECPGCAHIQNMDGTGTTLEDEVAMIRALAEAGRLSVFDPKTGEWLSHEEIDGVCLNGPCIQISLAEER